MTLKKLQDSEERYVSTQGHLCVVCKGWYPFPSKEARGLYPYRNDVVHGDVFICWECVHSLFKIFAKSLCGNSYKQLFLKNQK